MTATNPTAPAPSMRPNAFWRLLGSIRIAVPLLITIAMVLAWGTIYESRFGTAAVQRFVYTAWWFQALLAFLAFNLALAALARYPWKRRHLPFVLAHLGIILILIGGIVGGQFGIDGRLIIPEGQAERTLETPGNVLIVHAPAEAHSSSGAAGAPAGQAAAGLHQVIPTRFESQAWVHEPNSVVPIRLGERTIRLTVDRYYPDAVSDERITGDGLEDNPAVHVLIEHEEQREAVWLLSRDAERFGVGWGAAHLLFLEPADEAQLAQLLGQDEADASARGVVSVKLPGSDGARRIPVPAVLNEPMPIDGTPYRITFKDYFSDFAITSQGLVSRSAEPSNPAVSFTLEGPEGVDAYLLFAWHPEFQSIHGLAHSIPAEVGYIHTGHSVLPPNGIGLVRRPSSGTLSAVLTTEDGRLTVMDAVETGAWYTHPSLGYRFSVAAFYPKARLVQQVRNRTDEIRAEAIHVVGREGAQEADAWLTLRGTATLPLGREPVAIEYRPDRYTLPFTIKLLDFRKIDYPGTQMASGFESDVELSDSKRGLMLVRTIKMNQPLKYRGFSLYQSSFVPGEVQTTVLSVRNDPGTPFVYAGFLIVIGGVVSMFILRALQSRTVSRRLS